MTTLEILQPPLRAQWQLLEMTLRPAVRIFGLLLIGLATTLSHPSAVQAQCHDPNECSGGHRLNKEENWSYEGYHTYCGTCVFGGLSCHDMCANDDEDSDLAYATILDAAARGDVDSLVRFLPERPDRIKLNVARKSLQIMSCSGGSLIANVPLDNVAFGLARSGLALAEAAEVVEAPELQRF